MISNFNCVLRRQITKHIGTLYIISFEKSTVMTRLRLIFFKNFSNLFKIAHNVTMEKQNYNEKSLSKQTRVKIFAVLTGVLAGLTNGVFGGGGGMIVVPMLVYLLGCERKSAHATAILIILPLSIVSGIFYAMFGNFNLRVGVPAGIGVVIGGAFGAFLLSKLSSKWISIIFSALMVVAGIKMLLF